jgi:hypothetical protein
MSIEPANLTAQMQHRAAGNPPSTLPAAAISNCFPGLEFDFRNIWRRIFEGIELHEAHGLVTATTNALSRLRGLELVEAAGERTLVEVRGPTPTDPDAVLDASFIEWSNALAGFLRTSAGQAVTCRFARPPANPNAPRDATPPIVATAELVVRPLFAHSDVTDGPTGLIDEAIAQPGELTQSLCSPWQNDYRECGCYYWAASRPDYVNRESTPQGPSIGNDWMARSYDPKVYHEPDSGRDPEQFSYEDLFDDWQGLLRFIVGGQDSE